MPLQENFLRSASRNFCSQCNLTLHFLPVEGKSTAAEFRKGNTAGAQEVLKPLMDNKEAEALLKKMNGK